MTVLQDLMDWFFFGLLDLVFQDFIHSVGFSRTLDRIIRQSYLTIQTYNTVIISAREEMLYFQPAVFTTIFVILRIPLSGNALFFWAHHKLAYFVVLKRVVTIHLSYEKF